MSRKNPNMHLGAGGGLTGGILKDVSMVGGGGGVEGSLERPS